MESIFFDSWQSIIRTLVITILAYMALLVLLRSFGKRSLSKMNAFDFIITIALGSTMATVSLTKNVALADGVLAFLLLLGLQFSITWLSVRNKTVKGLVTSTPALLYYKGQLLHSVMKKERITIEEVNAKVREHGYSSLKEVEVVVLETTGDITIIKQADESGQSALQNVKHFKEVAQ
ncbi:MAG: DUF421 domain-containing protein [Chitinophagaceae bacterium]